MKVVASFGQEDLEIKNYNYFLRKCHEGGNKAAYSAGMSMGFFNACMYVAYAYAFLIGAVWIDKPFWNHAEGRDYMGGDCIGVFFGVLIGMFSLGGAGPAIASVNVAKATGKIVFGVIEREVLINQDDPKATRQELKGKIEFKNV